MSTEIREARPESKIAPAAPVKKESLRTVVAQVLSDSQAKPGEYLDEVVVPKGGE